MNIPSQGCPKMGNPIRKNDHSVLDVGAPCQTNPNLSRSSNVNVLRGNVIIFGKYKKLDFFPSYWPSNYSIYIPYMFTTYKSA
jgi:hypothetical protein